MTPALLLLLATARVGILVDEVEGLDNADRNYLIAEVSSAAERVSGERVAVGDFATEKGTFRATANVETVLRLSMVRGAALVRISMSSENASKTRRTTRFDGSADRGVWGAALPGLVEAVLGRGRPEAATSVEAMVPIAASSEVSRGSGALAWSGLAIGAAGIAAGVTLRLLAVGHHSDAESFAARQMMAESRPEWEMLETARMSSAGSEATLGTASNVTLIVSSALTGAAIAALLGGL